MDNIDTELTKLVDDEIAADLRSLWSWLAKVFPDPEPPPNPLEAVNDQDWVDELVDRSTVELAAVALTAIKALDLAHHQDDTDDGFAAIRYSVLFTTPTGQERLGLRGALDLACEITKIRRNSGLIAAQAHLDGPLGAPAHDDRAELCRQLLGALVAYALATTPDSDPDTARSVLIDICGQPPT